MKVANNSASARVGTGEGGSNSAAYELISPSYYTAVVENADLSYYDGKYTGQAGTFKYAKLTPRIRILNPQGTLITRQDFTIGTLDSTGALFRPDGDLSKPALFSPTSFLLQALGFLALNEEGDTVVDIAGFDPSLIRGQVIRVQTIHKSFTTRENEIKFKNEVKSTYAVRQREIEELGLVAVNYTAGTMYFLTEDAANDFESLWNNHRDRQDVQNDIDNGDIPF